VCVCACVICVCRVCVRNLCVCVRNLCVTGAQFCRAQMDALHAARTYLCLLTSTRLHLRLHEHYHAPGERSLDQVAGLVGLRLPTQPGGKGWET
uniref:Protein FMC1 homolog n=1 Tax=Sinocyclocheilus grahami TaxID=75366 RepID=A0A672NE98_SINGR